MSKNIDQVFIANPITSNAATDLMYFGQSPYGAGNDAAMTYSNFSAQFGAPYTAAALTSGNDTNVTLTLGGTPTTALLHAASITAGWTGQLSVARGGTAAASFSINGVVISNTTTTGALAALTLTNGQIVIGSTAGAPAAASLTAGSGITITPGSNSISIAASSGAGSPLTTKGDLYTFTTVNARLAVGTVDGQILQVSSGAATGLAYSTPSYPSASGSAGVILRSNGTNNVYSTSTFADTYAASTILYSNGANTVTGLATANSSVLVTTSAGVPIQSGTLTNGQMIIGSTGATPAVGTITGSGNISVTTGAGTLALATTGLASFAYNDVSGTTQAAAVNNGYIISNASQTTVTLPATAAEGSVIAVQGKGAAGWILTANTGQVINLGNTASSTAGSLTSTNLWDAVEVVCVTANTTWAVKCVVGNLTVT